MTYQSAAIRVPSAQDAGARIAQLRHVLTLVAELARRTAPLPDAALDQDARIGAAYAEALPIVQRRFDALALEASAWAMAGAEALLAVSPPSAAAAERLADELERAIAALARTLKPGAAESGQAIP